MRIFGEVCLLVSFVGAAYSSFACLLSIRKQSQALHRAGVASGVLTFLGLTGCMAILAWALATKDFGFEYVAHYTSQVLPWHYSLSALWVGQAGSLLLWTWFLGLLSLVFLASAPATSRLRAPCFGILMANVCFLITIMVFAADPMKASVSNRSDGLGLSPLLQHPSMLIHPPVVFLAYAAWTVPFGLAVSALLTGELGTEWIRRARPWALCAWTVLGAGLLLGANWAYQELGWGGYWGWDPVENGSLIPWLTGTATIHCLMAWRYRGCFKKMAIALAILTFGLCNFATFLTRSGIFSSVHAFSQSPIGWMFLGLMAVLVAGGGALLVMRRRDLVPERPSSSMFARESLVMLSTYLLLLLTAVVVVGTLFVPLSKIFVGRMIQIGPAFYNRVLMPISVLLFAATAVVPLVRWGGLPKKRERWALLVSITLACIGSGIAAGSGVRHPLAICIAGLLTLAISATIAALVLDVQRYSTVSFWIGTWLALRNKRRQYAAYVVHLAIACIVIGVTGSSLGTSRHEVELREGETIEWAGRTIQYLRLIQREDAGKLIAEVELQITQRGNSPVILVPARHFHLAQNQWTTEVAIDSTWSGDFYTVLHAGLGEGQVVLTLVNNPLMRWIWFGGWLAACGVFVAAWPDRKKRAMQGGLVDDRERSRLDSPPADRIAA